VHGNGKCLLRASGAINSEAVALRPAMISTSMQCLQAFTQLLILTLQACLTNPGVVIVDRHQVLAYMVTGFQMPWKGQQAVFVPEYCHGAVVANKREYYQRMYLYLTQE
jgi:hypothetical protein